MKIPTPSHFKCSHCGATWAAVPEGPPGHKGWGPCPFCGGLYMKWLDFPGGSIYDHDYPGKPPTKEKLK